MFRLSDCRVCSQRAHSAQKIAVLLVAGLSLAIASQRARATEPVKIP
jgi:hypothetical protein